MGPIMRLHCSGHAYRALGVSPVRYHCTMDQDDDAPRPMPPGWLEALERSDADLAAGRTVPGEVVMERLRRTIAEIEADAKPRLGEAVPQR